MYLTRLNVQKVERKCCYEAELYDWIKTLYGEDPTFNWSQFGLPNNKYELAAVTMQVLGEGNFGKVWKAEVDDICGYEGTILVAVKGVKASVPSLIALDPT